MRALPLLAGILISLVACGGGGGANNDPAQRAAAAKLFGTLYADLATCEAHNAVARAEGVPVNTACFTTAADQIAGISMPDDAKASVDNLIFDLRRSTAPDLQDTINAEAGKVYDLLKANSGAAASST